MEAKAEITMLELMLESARNTASLWESLQKAEESAHKRTKQVAWKIMGRAILRENSYGDISEIALDINDWRELCELMDWGIV